MAPEKDSDSAPSSASQSKRPPLSRQHSEVSDGQHRTRQHQKQHHVGRLHNRVPSSKALHKQQGQGHQSHAHLQSAAGGKTGANASSARRALSPTSPVAPQQHSRPSSVLKPHQRTTSEIRLPWENAANSLQKSASQSNIKRNRSHGEIHKRTRSSDKIKRHSGGGGGTASHRPKSSKGQVHFDLGSDGQDEDEWVDASGSNSPHLSRKGSINSSAQSSVRPLTTSASNSRPETPVEPAQPEQPSAEPEREREQRKDYPTNRLLKRTPSHIAQVQMSTEMAQATQPRISPDPSNQNSPSTVPSSGGKEGLTSRFVNTPGSGITSEGSFYRPATSNGLQPEETTRKARSTVDLSQSHDALDSARIVDDRDDSALVPKSGRRAPGKPAEPSRIQQKLNLQRASSAIETRHTPPSVTGNIGTSPLIGVSGPGYDGAGGRDPRMGKLMERTGMEYLVVRRYQNPVGRSLGRLGAVPSSEKTKRIPRTNTGSTNSKRSFDLAVRHARKTSASRPVTPRDATSIRTATGSSYEGEDDNRLNEGLSGSSLVGGEDDDGTAAILRSLWEKSMDLSASGD